MRLIVTVSDAIGGSSIEEDVIRAIEAVSFVTDVREDPDSILYTERTSYYAADSEPVE